jgi:hypothetical protein
MSNMVDLFSIFKQQSFDACTNDVLSKIKFIGRIKEGDKINVKYMSIQSDSWYTRLMRTFIVSENRTGAYNFIEATINLAFDIVDRQQTNNEHILDDLKRACEGLNNLKKTYQDDIMFCCKLETLAEDITARLKTLTDRNQVKMLSKSQPINIASNPRISSQQSSPSQSHYHSSQQSTPPTPPRDAYS